MTASKGSPYPQGNARVAEAPAGTIPCRDIWYTPGLHSTCVRDVSGYRVYMSNAEFEAFRAAFERQGYRFFSYDPAEPDPGDRR